MSHEQPRHALARSITQSLRILDSLPYIMGLQFQKLEAYIITNDYPKTNNPYFQDYCERMREKERALADELDCILAENPWTVAQTYRSAGCTLVRLTSIRQTSELFEPSWLHISYAALREGEQIRFSVDRALWDHYDEQRKHGWPILFRKEMYLSFSCIKNF